MVRSPKEDVLSLVQSIAEAKQKISLCSICQNITEVDPCAICSSQGRDHTKICVVEGPVHVEAIEKSQKYDGVYHVLHGVLSPTDGIGPDNLKIAELMSRVREGGIREIILATNPNMEGETTALYLYRLISPLGAKISRLAVGLPFGSDVEYADEITIGKAIEGRGEFAPRCGENTRLRR